MNDSIHRPIKVILIFSSSFDTSIRNSPLTFKLLQSIYTYQTVGRTFFQEIHVPNFSNFTDFVDEELAGDYHGVLQ